jgi:hypothetical protein
MKNIILFLGSILIFFFSGCSEKSCCNKKGCSTKQIKKNATSNHEKKMNKTKDNTCNQCGNTSCDESCTTNPTTSNGDSTMNEEILKGCEDKFSVNDKKKAEKLLSGGFIKKIKSIKELEMGYEFRYEEPISFAAELVEAITLDKKCASAYSLALVFERNSNVILYQYLASSKESKAEIGSMIEKFGLGYLLQR